MYFTWFPDWAALGAVLGLPPPGHEVPCSDCLSRKSEFAFANYTHGATREWRHFRTTPKEFLGLFQSPFDLGYDVPHCCSLVLSHQVFHSLHFWVLDHCEGKAVQLHELYREYTGACPYCPPAARNVVDDWKTDNNLFKAVLYNDKFWAKLDSLLPRTATGLSVMCLQTGIMLVDPLLPYLELIRALCMQMMSWTPRNVDQRDADCKELHWLHTSLGLEPRRFGVALHYFLEHYTARLLRHGNLQGSSSEGGEHTNVPNKGVIANCPSFPRHKCPQGVRECVMTQRTHLGLWGIGKVRPQIVYQTVPSLPPCGPQAATAPPFG